CHSMSQLFRPSKKPSRVTRFHMMSFLKRVTRPSSANAFPFLTLMLGRVRRRSGVCCRLSRLALRGRETVELIVRDGSVEPAVIGTALEQLDRSALQQPHRRVRGTRTEADSCDAQFLEVRDGGKALPNHDVDREPQCPHERRDRFGGRQTHRIDAVDSHVAVCDSPSDGLRQLVLGTPGGVQEGIRAGVDHEGNVVRVPQISEDLQTIDMFSSVYKLIRFEERVFVFTLTTSYIQA